MSTESLIVELDARTAKLDAKLNTTNDRLAKLDGAVQKTDKRFLGLSKAGELAGKGITMVAAAGVAAAAALTAATAQAVSFAKELNVASRRSGENVESLQSLAFATKTVGVDLEKLGDISKDTNEKVGEFLADGTGGFLDFVSVAKLTSAEAQTMAERFKDMTGPDILQAMVTRMEEAGAETKEMSFALEGMASDTTDLIPLLIDGGAKLKLLRKDFTDLNVTLTQLDLDKITNIGVETSKLAVELQNSSAKTVSVLSEEIIKITQLLAGSAQDVGGLVVKAVTGYQAIVVSATSGLMNMFREAEILALEAKSFIVNVFGDNSDIEAELAKLKESDALRDAFDATYLAEQWAAAKLKVSEYYGEIKTQEGAAPAVTTPEPDGSDPSTPRISDVQKKALESIKDRFKTENELLLEKYDKDKAVLDLTVSDQIERQELQTELAAEYEENLNKIKEDAASKAIRIAQDVASSEVDLKRQSTTAIVSILSAMVGQSDDAGKALFLLSKGLAFSEAFVNTQAATIKALTIDPTGALSAKVQIAGNLSMAAIATAAFGVGGGGGSGGGGGGGVPNTTAPTFAEQQTSFVDQGATITDISGQDQTTQTVVFEFSDEAVDVLSRHVQKSQSDRRT